MGEVEEEWQKNSGDGMPPMPGGWGTRRQSLYLADEGGREELQGDTYGEGQLT